MEKINTKKYVYVVSSTYEDECDVEVFKDESKAKAKFMEERKNNLETWDFENIKLNKITNRNYDYGDEYVSDQTNYFSIIDTSEGRNCFILKLIKTELK